MTRRLEQVGASFATTAGGLLCKSYSQGKGRHLSTTRTEAGQGRVSQKLPGDRVFSGQVAQGEVVEAFRRARSQPESV